MSLIQNKLKVEAVIFDLDGTLIDSIDIYFKIVEKALATLNLPQVSRQRILAAAESEDFNWALVLPEAEMDRKDEIIDEAWQIINEIAPQMFRQNVKLIPGADTILRNLSSRGLKIGLVTSTQRQYLKNKMRPLESAGVDTLFEIIITSDDAHKRKPAPEPLLECAKRLQVNPDKCIYVGDTQIDIKAGKAAGMQTVSVQTGFDEYEALKKENPDAIIDGIRDLMAVIAF
jgi:HAD superfamily hydrolase (TIGR01662 family)